MGGKQRPAALGRERASGDVVAGQRDDREFNRTRTEKQVGEVSIYDGLTAVGHLLPRGPGHWLAYSDSGKFLGQFGSDRLAAKAVFEASRPRGCA